MHVMPNFCAISDRGSRVVECRQAVHELHVRIASLEQALVRNTKGLKETDALSPLVLGLTHRQQHVGIDEIGPRSGPGIRAA